MGEPDRCGQHEDHRGNQAGHHVQIVTNGRAALQAIDEQSFDLVLMDVVMPGMNGFQATRQISTDPATNTIPIIIVSTKDQETDKMWGLRQGAKDYITKPAKEKELVNKINGILGA